MRCDKDRKLRDWAYICGAIVLLSLTACGKSVDRFEEGSSTVGFASWYGPKFHGRKTASGEIYDMHQLTAAHRYAPFGARVRVVNLENDRSVLVRINDRGPFVKGRIIDLSLEAAKQIGLVQTGTARVRLEFMGVGAAPSGRDYEYYVQAGSFMVQTNAQDLLKDLNRFFPDEPGHIEYDGGLYRVYLGPKPREDEARSLIDRLRSEGFTGFLAPKP